MVQQTVLPGMDAYNRVLVCRDGFLAEIVREALRLALFDGTVLSRLGMDIDRTAKEAKKVRLMDELWQDEALPRFPSWADTLEPSDFDSVDSEGFALYTGRPRAITPELLLVLVVVDGVFSLTSAAGYDQLIGSEVFQAITGNGAAPARSTVGKYLGLVSAETREYLHRALFRMVKAEGLDGFEELTIDSTAVAANTAWPSESALIAGFLRRIHRLLEKQSDYTGVAYGSKLVDRWLRELDGFHRSISLLPSRPGSRSTRRRLYTKLLIVAEKVQGKLRDLLDTRLEEITECCIRPTLRLRVNAMLERVQDAFDEASKAMASARLRVIHGESVPAADKVYSLADPDAYMIVKGEREPVVGYKPQLGRSAEGFISCFEVTRGNPADSDRLLPMFEAHREATGTAALAVSTDDGYSSGANLDKLIAAGVHVVSFSGSTGRKVLGEDVYTTDAWIQLRNDRSAVESTIFTFKHKLHMRRFCRRGLDGVQADLSAAVLAYNLWRTAFVRRARFQRQEQEEPLRRTA